MTKHWNLRRVVSTLAFVGMSSAAHYTVAYEGEDAVPLTLAAEVRDLTVSDILIELNGSKVVISTSLRNHKPAAQTAGFYSYTPQFSRLGAGEKYADKTFSELAVSVDGRKVKVHTTNRGYFMGQDITAALIKAGLPRLPDPDVPESKLARLPKILGIRPSDWQGYVSHSWSYPVPPRSKLIQTVSYQALPAFNLELIDSGHFEHLVSAACGDPVDVATRVKAADPSAEAIYMEQYEIPVAFIGAEKIAVKVLQKTDSGPGTVPFISLMCEVSAPTDGADLVGVLYGPSPPLRILVIFLINQKPRVVPAVGFKGSNPE